MLGVDQTVSRIKNPTSVTSLNIKELNSESELMAAHDLLSEKLKTMLEIGQSQPRDEEIIMQMIAQVKAKYQAKKGITSLQFVSIKPVPEERSSEGE